VAGLIARLRRWAHAVKRDLAVLFLAARDPRVGWLPRLLILLLLAYALSPIDLIPDFVPVLGYLDDFLLLPIGILLVMALLPKGLLAELRAEVKRYPVTMPRSRAGMVLIVVVWLIAGAVLLWWGGLFIRGGG